MGQGSAQDPDYRLGHSEAEQQRLIVQEAVYGPLTERLLRTAGIGPGMRVLDIGCGVGEVSRLAARLVGPTGEVVGVDKSAAALETARRRVAALRLDRVRFVEADLANLAFERPFDAAIGRFVLMHLGDPAASLRRVAAQVRPGGVIAFQESDFTIPPIAYPPVPTYQQVSQFWGPPKEVPVERQMGQKLYTTFLAAGLPPPQVRLEVPIGGGPDFPGYEYVAASLRSILPLAERSGFITRAEIEELHLETLADRLRAEVVTARGIITAPAVVGAWTEKPME